MATPKIKIGYVETDGVFNSPKVGELFPTTFLCWCFERMDASPFPNPEAYMTSCPFLSPLVTHKTSFLPHMHHFFSLHFQCCFSLLHMKAAQFPSIHGHAQHMSAAHTGTTARGHEVAASMHWSRNGLSSMAKKYI